MRKYYSVLESVILYYTAAAKSLTFKSELAFIFALFCLTLTLASCQSLTSALLIFRNRLEGLARVCLDFLGRLSALNAQPMITEHPTLVPIKLAHQVAHVQPLGAGWDTRAVVRCDRVVWNGLPISLSCDVQIACNVRHS
jgi:hypothetical protein